MRPARWPAFSPSLFQVSGKASRLFNYSKGVYNTVELDEIKARMHDGRLYLCADEALMAEQQQCLEKLYDFNATRPSEQA